MKKIIIFMTILMMLSAMPMVFAAGSGESVGGKIGVEDFEPLVFQCGDRILGDDDIQPWRVTSSTGGFCRDGAGRPAVYTDEATCEANGICIAYYYNESQCIAAMPITAWVNGVCTVPAFTDPTTCTNFGNTWVLNTWSTNLIERNQQYLFEGETYKVDILVFDKNKIQDDMVDLVLEGEERCVDSCGAVCKDAADREVTSYTTEATCEANGICTDPRFPSQTACTTAGGVWVNGVCTAPTQTTQTMCTDAGGVWVFNEWTPTCMSDCETFEDKLVNCFPISCNDINFDECNARIDEEQLTSCDPATMQAYTCSITILPSEYMYGLYWLKVRAESGLTGEEGEFDEIARWFINPIISLSVDGDFDFSDVRPGTSSYSTVLLENTAEGGVLLDMFITGKDWPAAGTQLGQCQNVDSKGNNINGYVNYLPLGAFRYYSENGADSTRDDAGIDSGYSSVVRDNTDAEGYININRQINAGFEEAMFDDAEIIQANPIPLPAGGLSSQAWLANILYPNSAGMSVTFRLNLPEPCYGEYEAESEGSIFFWGEAI